LIGPLGPILYVLEMLEKKIREILEKDVESLGCSIWGIEISGGAFSKNILIYIDKKNELISLQDCEQVNIQAREVLENFSELNFDFSLEISSPGIDRKFYNLNQMKDYLGETINLSFFLDGKKCKLKGELKQVSDEEISLFSQGQVYQIMKKDFLSSNLLGATNE
tara:strand:- start:202 stop:696 length:495 start_codon:yes stop_codon:yes gene_type:complete